MTDPTTPPEPVEARDLTDAEVTEEIRRHRAEKRTLLEARDLTAEDHIRKALSYLDVMVERQTLTGATSARLALQLALPPDTARVPEGLREAVERLRDKHTGSQTYNHGWSSALDAVLAALATSPEGGSDV